MFPIRGHHNDIQPEGECRMVCRDRFFGAQDQEAFCARKKRAPLVCVEAAESGAGASLSLVSTPSNSPTSVLSAVNDH